MKTILFSISVFLFSLLVFQSCDNTADAISDAQKLSKLKEAIFTYDSTQITFTFPEGALNGEPFDSLIRKDSATYANPANYEVTIESYLNADNNSETSDDAKFDGMRMKIVLDTIASNPLELLADGFDLPKGASKQIKADGTMNLRTHKLPCLYIFQQTVDGFDIDATISPFVLYEIGTITGEIPIAESTVAIPTRADAATKNFLQGLLDSQVFE
ncbi:MAG: hypothetical protein ACJAZ3_000666 [Sphingobacteriales bacterium]|jgi:hypothetical protein